MEFFNSKFYQNSMAIQSELKKLNIVSSTFPEITYIYENDVFWKELWKILDEAKVLN